MTDFTSFRLPNTLGIKPCKSEHLINMSMVPWHPDSYFAYSSWLTFLLLLILLHLKSMHCRSWLLPGLVPSGCHDNTPSEQALDAGLPQYNSGQERVQVTLWSPAGDEGRDPSQPKNSSVVLDHHWLFRGTGDCTMEFVLSHAKEHVGKAAWDASVARPPYSLY